MIFINYEIIIKDRLNLEVDKMNFYHRIFAEDVNQFANHIYSSGKIQDLKSALEIGAFIYLKISPLEIYDYIYFNICYIANIFTYCIILDAKISNNTCSKMGIFNYMISYYWPYFF